MFVKQNITGFEVAMNHAFLMGVVDSSTNGCKEMHNVSGRGHFSHGRSVPKVVSEGWPFYIVHHHAG